MKKCWLNNNHQYLIFITFLFKNGFNYFISLFLKIIFLVFVCFFCFFFGSFISLFFFSIGVRCKLYLLVYKQSGSTIHLITCETCYQTSHNMEQLEIRTVTPKWPQYMTLLVEKY